MDLHKIANTPGYGTGKAAIDRANQRADILSNLPEPGWMQPLRVCEEVSTSEIPMMHFGFSNDLSRDVQIGVEPFDLETWVFGKDAHQDAQIVAAIVNAYALGILVVARDAQGD